MGKGESRLRLRNWADLMGKVVARTLMCSITVTSCVSTSGERKYLLKLSREGVVAFFFTG